VVRPSCFVVFCVIFDLLFMCVLFFFFFSSRRRHTRLVSDWSSDVCSSDLSARIAGGITRGLLCRSSSVIGGASHNSLSASSGARSEERRVGKECRSRWGAYH